MTRLFTAGAEESNIKSLWTDLDATNTGYYYIWRRNTEDVYNPPGNAARTGEACYILMDSSAFIRHTWGTPSTEIYVGFASSVSALSTVNDFVRFYNNFSNTQYLSARITAGDTLKIYRTGTEIASYTGALVSLNAWHYYEFWFKPLNTGGRVTVKIDGTQVIDFTGDTTNGVETVDTFFIVGNNGIGNPCFVDDIVVNDAGGSVNNTWPGQIRLLPVRPNAAGASTQWTRKGVDMGSNHANARSRNRLSHIETGTTAQKDLYALEVPDIPAGSTIKNIVGLALGTVQNGSGSVKLGVRAGATENFGSAQALGADWKYIWQVWDQNPNTTSAWVEADLNGLQGGVESA